MNKEELAKFLFEEIDGWAYTHKWEDEGYDDVCIDGYVNLEEVARNIIALFERKTTDSPQFGIITPDEIRKQND